MTFSQGDRGPCERAGCDRPAHARGFCRVHYDRSRGVVRHRHRPERLKENRARHRATAKLIEAHRQEFNQILELARAEVSAEWDELQRLAEQAGRADGVVRLRSGPKSIDDEEITDRVRTGPQVQCGQCSGYHERGHKCPACAGKQLKQLKPSRKHARSTPVASAPVAVLSQDAQIERLLRSGKPAQWVAANLGEPMVDVMNVLQRLRQEQKGMGA